MAHFVVIFLSWFHLSEEDACESVCFGAVLTLFISDTNTVDVNESNPLRTAEFRLVTLDYTLDQGRIWDFFLWDFFHETGKKIQQ